MPANKEVWSSKLGVILAVAGSAVGLGNFLRFPGLAAQYGGGAFMIAYFVSLLVIGIPICWVEWTLGRQGGRHGYHSSPGIFHCLLRNRWGKFLGVIGFIVPVMIYMYYVYIEAWCLGYAVNALAGNLGPGTDFGAFFGTFTGANADGVAVKFGLRDVGLFVVIVYLLNFFFIYRGITKGIELVCKIAMPALVAMALIILLRVLTLGTPDAAKPEQNIGNGLGFMWNPAKPVVEQLVEDEWKVVETIASPDLVPAYEARLATDGTERITQTSALANLANPLLWLAAAGQIFFSLSVGFGVIITYASYMKRNDDVVLSGLTATSANEFCEVALGGLITVPAAFVFLGAAGVIGQGTFGLGFNVLPEVFALMPAGQIFASIFFVLLFLAAVTSSLSMLQPGIAFLEEGLAIGRKRAIAILAVITGFGTLFIWHYSADLKALDTIDFWIGTVMLFVQATILVILFAWGMGMKQGWALLHEGAEIQAPRIYRFVLRYITPTFLITIFVLFLLQNVFGWNYSFAKPEFAPTGYVRDLVGPEANPVARRSIAFIGAMILLTLGLTAIAGRTWAKREATGSAHR
ncbi:MAG: sodium:calcium symporter [Verrucomicrobiota bacterium]